MENAIEFAGYKCCIRKDTYVHKGSEPADRIALILEDVNDGEQVAVATTNIPEVPLKEKEVLIKNYSENEGILDTLVMAHIISVPKRYERGFPVCEVLI